MRTLKVEVPEDSCNECVFFQTFESEYSWLRQYRCLLFKSKLDIDRNDVVDDGKRTMSSGSVKPIYRAFPCKECKDESI